MSDIAVSIIRTVVPAAVGALLTWLADRLGIVDLDIDGAVAIVTTIVIAAYYAGARALEARNPTLGVLLGSRQAPTYGGDTETPPL